MNTPQPSEDCSATEREARFQRAMKLLQGYGTQSLVKNDTLFPHWIENTDCFWYQRTHEAGSEFRLIDADSRAHQPAFNHAALATELAKTAKQKVNPEDLPISSVNITLAPLTVCFSAFERHWRFVEDERICREVENPPFIVNAGISPDGQWLAFTRDYNLWVRQVESGKEWSLTDDGEEYFSYAAPCTSRGLNTGADLTPAPWSTALWSPDSSRLFMLQRDTRQVKTTPFVDHVPADGSIRPQVRHLKVAYSGDEKVEEYRLLAIDVATGHHCAARYPHIPASYCFTHFPFFVSRLSWWNNNSRHVYFIHQTRGEKILRVVEFDTDNGATRILFEETSNTHINVSPECMDFPLHVPLPETNELVWWSERSGWGQLYLYDLTTGKLKHPITQGDYLVRSIVKVDTTRRELWLQTAAREPSRNPYYRDICRVQLDSGELTTLISSDDDYGVHSPVANFIQTGVGDQLGVSPSGNYVVTTRSRADKVPTSFLLDREGETLLELEITDTSNLSPGWQWPEPIKMIAADGKTDIYGTLFRPSDFAMDKRYPVINMIASGPWLAAAPHGSFNNSRGYADMYYFLGAALAELGYMVVIIDSRGTPLRGKVFQDESYGWIPSSANTADHCSALEQLAQRYPSMDSNRVAIFGPSGYQSSIQNLMECPDFYKVGVFNMLQDSRLIGCTAETDKYQGVDGPAEGKRFPEELADDFTANLLLFHPYGDSYAQGYLPAASFRLFEALRKANKNVDLLMIPARAMVCSDYELRHIWDYLLKYL